MPTQIKTTTSLLLIVFFLSISTKTWATPQFSETKNYYDIQGLDVYDLKSQMELKGPKINHGTTIFVKTHWDVNWQYDFYEANNKCKLRLIKIKLKVDHKIPKWTNIKKAPTNLQNEWNLYLKSVSAYTAHHKKIGYKAAKKIEDTLIMMRSESTCERLSKNAEILSSRILKNYRDMDKAYDERTNFGRSEGLIFP